MSVWVGTALRCMGRDDSAKGDRDPYASRWSLSLDIDSRLSVQTSGTFEVTAPVVAYCRLISCRGPAYLQNALHCSCLCSGGHCSNNVGRFSTLNFEIKRAGEDPAYPALGNAALRTV